MPNKYINNIIYYIYNLVQLAIVKTMEHFHKFLYRQELHLHKDHSSLTWLLSFKNLEEQMACWVRCLQEHNANALSWKLR
jgi:hypothetical protein